MKLAQSLQETARLRRANEALESDVGAMIDLKLEIAELRKAARE